MQSGARIFFPKPSCQILACLYYGAEKLAGDNVKKDKKRWTEEQEAFQTRLSRFIASAPKRGINLQTLVEQLEIQCTQLFLRRSKGSISQAARLMHIPRSTLSSKTNKWGIKA